MSPTPEHGARIAGLIHTALHDTTGTRTYDWYTMTYAESAASQAVRDLWDLLRAPEADRLRAATLDGLRSIVRDPAVPIGRVCDILTGYDTAPIPALESLVAEFRADREPRVREIYLRSAYGHARNWSSGYVQPRHIALSMLGSDDPTSRAWGIFSLTHPLYPAPGDNELVIAALDDPDVRVRMAASRRVQSGEGGAGVQALLRRSAVEPEPFVQDMLLDGLGRVAERVADDDTALDPLLAGARNDLRLLPAVFGAMAGARTPGGREKVAAAVRAVLARPPTPAVGPAETASRLQALIEARAAPQFADRVVGDCIRNHAALPVVGNQIHVWALRATGAVIRLDHESVSDGADPETDPVVVFAVRLRAAVRHPALAGLLTTAAPEGSGPCLPCAGRGDTADGPCLSCSGLGWTAVHGRR